MCELVRNMYGLGELTLTSGGSTENLDPRNTTTIKNSTNLIVLVFDFPNHLQLQVIRSELQAIRAGLQVIGF